MKLWTVVSNGDDGIVSQIATSAEDAARLAYGFVAEFWNDMRSDALPDDWQAAMEVLTSMPTFMDGVYVQEHEVELPVFVGVDLASGPDETLFWLPYKTRADLLRFEHPAFSHLDADTSGNPCVWENFYSCDHMGDTDDEPESWQSEWSCQCDEDCPVCGRSCEPNESVWLVSLVNDEAMALWESLPEAGALPSPDPVREAYEDAAAQTEAEGIAREEERLSDHSGDAVSYYMPWADRPELQRSQNESASSLLSKLLSGAKFPVPVLKYEGLEMDALAEDAAKHGMAIVQTTFRADEIYSFRVKPEEFFIRRRAPLAVGEDTDLDANLAPRAAPHWAWEIIDQTLEADSLSSAFDPNLRAMIRAATVAMLLACESANDEPISRQRVDDLIGEGTET